MGMGGLFQGGVPKLRPVGGKKVFECLMRKMKKSGWG